MVVNADVNRNFQEATGIVMDLYEGKAREVRVGGTEDAQSCDFVISGPYSSWKRVVRKELDAIRGMLQGKLKLKGDLPTVVRYTKATQELSECMTRVPTIWPDGA